MMREKLISYVELLFAGATDSDEIKQEILQNTLDRYDDLVAQGKTPEAAYQLAISGIGDINEIIGTAQSTQANSADRRVTAVMKETAKPVWKKALQAIGICLYILCPIPLLVLQNELGLCGLLGIVAIATALVVVASTGDKERKEQYAHQGSAVTEMHKAINTAISVIGLVLYFVVSFSTGAWYITWVIFPIIGAVRGLVRACFDLKEANANEK